MQRGIFVGVVEIFGKIIIKTVPAGFSVFWLRSTRNVCGTDVGSTALTGEGGMNYVKMGVFFSKSPYGQTEAKKIKQSVIILYIYCVLYCKHNMYAFNL